MRTWSNRISRARAKSGWALLAVLLVAAPQQAPADDVIYAPPSAEAVRTRVLDWVAQQEIEDERKREEIAKQWVFAGEAPPTPDLFEKALDTFADADPGAAKLIEACRLVNAPLTPPEATVLQPAADRTEFFLANMRYFYARYLSQRRMYDKAIDVFAETDVKQVVDPAGCLFYKAVCEHSLLRKDEGLATLKALLQNTEDVPVRYSTVAELMQYDLEALKEKSLDEIARKMSDVERRLDLGRGGQKVQKVEEEIVAALDEIIKKLEQQNSGGGGGGSGSGNNPQNQSSSPADDSRVKGRTAPGEVDEKKIGHKSGWGALDPKAETKAKNLINRNFPSHYRDAIEQYFKKLANRRASTGR